MLAHAFARHVTSKAMEMNRGKYCFHNALRILRDQAGHHASKNVSRASSGHARISRSVYPNRTVGLRNQRAMSLQHHDQFVFASEDASDVDAVPLHGGYRRSSKTRHLAGMRRDHQGSSFAVELVSSTFKRVETIRVEDERSFALHYQIAHKLRRLGIARDPRSDRQNCLAFNKCVHCSASASRNAARVSFIKWFSHYFGMKSRDSGEHGLRRSHRR